VKRTLLTGLLVSLSALAEPVLHVALGTRAAAPSNAAATWTKSQSLLDGISNFPLTMQLVRALQDAADPELSPCSNESALVMDPQNPRHLQSKAFIYTTGAGVTTLTAINRTTEQDEILVVRPSVGTWAFHTQPSYAQKKPTPASNVLEGSL